MAETKSSQKTKTAESEKLSTKIDKMTADSAKLKEEVAVLQKELANLAESQQTMDKIRAEEKAEFDDVSAELEKGLTGIKKALQVFRDYYAKGDSTASGNAGGGIISMLEVVESDFTKDAQETESTESMAVTEYEQTTKENDIAKLTKDQDVKYLTKEAQETEST